MFSNYPAEVPGFRWWVKLRRDLTCPQNWHFVAWSCGRERIRRLTLRSATGLSQRDKHYLGRRVVKRS